MPQLSPMNWFILFLFFNFIFYMLILKNFFLSDKIYFTNKKSIFKKMYMFYL